MISVATAHVKTEWNKLTIPPRQYKYCSKYLQELTAQYEGLTKAYYVGLSDVTNTELIAMLKRKVDAHGKHPTLTGTKEELVARLFEYGYVDFINFLHPIRDPVLSALVDSIWGDTIMPGTAPPKLVTFFDLATLRTGISPSYEAFIASIDLINRSDSNLCNGYDQVYLKSSNPSSRQKSLIVHPAAAQRCMHGANGSLIAMGIELVDLPYRVYIPLRLDNVLIVVDFNKKQFYLYNVKYPADPRRVTIKATK